MPVLLILLKTNGLIMGSTSFMESKPSEVLPGNTISKDTLPVAKTDDDWMTYIGWLNNEYKN